MIQYYTKGDFVVPCPLCSQLGENDEIKGAFFWDYSGIGILGIDGICVLLGAKFRFRNECNIIPFILLPIAE